MKSFSPPESKTVVFNPLSDPILKEFLSFWNAPLDNIIQDILNGTNMQLEYRLGGDLHNALETDKTKIENLIIQLEQQKNKSISEWLLLGLCYNFKGQGDEHHRCVLTANKLANEEKVSLDKYHPILLFELGELHSDKIRYPRAFPPDNKMALEYYQAAANNKLGVALYTLGTLAKQKGEIDEAKNYYQEAMTNHYFAAYYDWIKIVDQEQSFAEIREYLQQAVRQGVPEALRTFVAKEIGATDPGRTAAYYRYAAEILPLHDRYIFFDCLFDLYIQNNFNGKYITSENNPPHPEVLYHTALLLLHSENLRREFNRRGLEDTVYEHPTTEAVICYKKVIAQFKMLAITNFELFNQLTDADPWEDIANLLNDPELANSLLSQKIEIHAQQIANIFAPMHNANSALADFNLLQSIEGALPNCHPSYMPLIMAKVYEMLDFKDPASRHAFKACQQLCQVVDAHRKVIRQSLISQLNNKLKFYKIEEKPEAILKQLSNLYTSKDDAQLSVLEKDIKNDKSIKKDFKLFYNIANLQKHVDIIPGSKINPEKRIVQFREELTRFNYKSSWHLFSNSNKTMVLACEKILHKFDKKSKLRPRANW